MLRDFRALRVPEAREPKVSLRVVTSAAKRAVLASRALQSGLEREFLELLTEHGLAHEFEPQRSIAIDVAATAGAGRRSILTTADFAHCSLPYIVYLDGRMAHATERALANDNEISAELNRMGGSACGASVRGTSRRVIGRRLLRLSVEISRGSPRQLDRHSCEGLALLTDAWLRLRLSWPHALSLGWIAR